MSKRQQAKRNRAKRSCTRKVRYATEREAARASSATRRRHYYCPKCSGYHLASF